jgi:acyl-CoA synthetase (AMP-forming)/AMP-acid ligase II
MLHRMLNRDARALISLRCIITGGAMLSPALARESLEKLGPTLFNLYGTSEGGFAIMATPDMLAHKPESIGKPVRGVRARIVSEADQEVGEKTVGRLCLRSSWTTSKKNWIETGDLAYWDAEGDLFLCGRVDDMIVSGAENVYPVELENVLVKHADVAAVAVVGITDAEFGQRLKAVVVTKKGSPLDLVTLLEWLKPRVARHQIPAVVELRDELPYTPLGKIDKKALRG